MRDDEVAIQPLVVLGGDEDDFSAPEESFGTFKHFRSQYNQKVESFLREFFDENLDEVISHYSPDHKVEEFKDQIYNLIDVHHRAMDKFDVRRLKL